MWQQLADVLEATIWEKVQQGANRRLWRKVAEEFVESAESDWPSNLCSFEHAQQIGVDIEMEALRRRFTRLAKKRTPVRNLRAAALKIIQRAGQMSTPPDGMSLWQYFKPDENTVINKGALASKEHALDGYRKRGRKQKRGRQPAAAPTAAAPASAPAAEMPTFPPTFRADIPAEPTLDELLGRLLPSPTLPGVQRGKAAGIGKQKGRGGAIQEAFKMGIVQLVTEDSVPIRDVPKVLVDMIVILTQEAHRGCPSPSPSRACWRRR